MGVHILMVFFLFVAEILFMIGWVLDKYLLAMTICFIVFDLLTSMCLTWIMSMVNGKGHDTHIALANYRTKKVMLIGAKIEEEKLEEMYIQNIPTAIQICEFSAKERNSKEYLEAKQEFTSKLLESRKNRPKKYDSFVENDSESADWNSEVDLMDKTASFTTYMVNNLVEIEKFDKFAPYVIPLLSRSSKSSESIMSYSNRRTNVIPLLM
jgi:hypothetical protein